MIKGLSFKIYPSTIGSWIGVKSVSLIFTYIENIKMFFPVERKTAIKKDILYFTCNIIAFKTIEKSEKEHHLTHKIKYICRKLKIAYTIKDINDLIILIGQYANIGLSKVYSIINNVITCNFRVWNNYSFVIRSIYYSIKNMNFLNST